LLTEAEDLSVLNKAHKISNSISRELGELVVLLQWVGAKAEM